MFERIFFNFEVKYFKDNFVNILLLSHDQMTLGERMYIVDYQSSSLYDLAQCLYLEDHILSIHLFLLTICNRIIRFLCQTSFHSFRFQNFGKKFISK